ncbi:MAG: threonine synthase, partial [Terriglobales bacterium]
GTAVAVTDEEIVGAQAYWAKTEGIFAAPEGAASLACYRKLIRQKFLSPDKKMVLFNTGSGLKYMDDSDNEPSKARSKPASRNIGGIIQPY